MSKLGVWRAVLFAMLALGAGSAWSQARIESFSPTGYAKDVRQVAVRFSEAMVALGEPEQSDPFGVDCEVPGNGRWIDERHWVYDFDYDVPGAVRCRFSPRAVRTIAGEPVHAPTEYAFNTGGPAIIDWLPRWERIDENQVFVLALDAVADTDSVREHARCETAGAGAYPVDLVRGIERTEILDALAAADIHSVESLVKSLVKSASSHLPPGSEHETHTRALERIVMVRCRDALPAGSDIELVWGPGVAGLNGMATTQARALPFSVRPAFEAHPACTNRFDGRCVGGIHVHFTALVDREVAGRLRLVDDNGEVVPAEAGDEPEVQLLRFPTALDKTSYRAEIVAPITDVDGRALTNATSFPKTIQVGRLPPGASFGTGLQVAQQRDGPVARVLLRRVDEPLAGQRLRVTDDGDIANWMRRVENLRDTETDLWDAVAAERSVFEAVARGIPTTLTPGDQPQAFHTAGMPLPGPGFHVVELELPAVGSLPRRYVAGLVVVTDLAIHVHRAAESSLVWVTGLSDGLPVQGADIAFRDACTGRVVARGATDARGIARVPGPLPWRDACADFRYLVTARKDGDLAVWTSGQRWESERHPRFVAHQVLDRALYQPGETVSAKIIVRRASPDGLALPGGLATKAKVTIEHYGTDASQEASVDVAADGSALVSFDLPANAKLGYYGIDLEINGRPVWTRGFFRVERFRIGAMRATVDGPPEPLVSTGSVPVTLSVEHLAGGPAGSLPVAVRTRVRRWLNAWEYRQPPEPRETSVTLDSTGKAELAIPLPALEGRGALDVEMDYPDANGQLKTASKRFELWPAAIDLVVWDGWESAGGDASVARKQFRVRARKLDDTPATGVPVAAKIYAHRHYENRRLPGGFRGVAQVSESPLLGTCSGRTDADGFVACDAPPDAPARAFVEAAAPDGHGNTARTTGRISFSKRPRPWVKVDEERQYAVGESVPVELDIAFPESTVLVAIHRESVLDAFVERVKGPGAVINVPVRRNYAPNVEVSVLAIQPGERSKQVLSPGNPQPVESDFGIPDRGGPDYRLGAVNIRVGRDANTLSVSVEPDRDTYRTRERAAVRIAVAGPDGLPRPDAEVALAAVDEGLLDLWPNETWDILGVMMAERYSRVYSSTSMPRPDKRRTILPRPAFGSFEDVIVTGSYQRSPGFGLPQPNEDPKIRENFDALLLWRRRLAMDERGMANVEIPLNDLLTSFRIVAIATAGADLFGTGEATIQTTQDLILHAGLPEVVRTGDRFDAVFNLRNASSTRHRASVVAEVDGIAKLRRKRLTLRPGESRQVSWPVKVPTGIEQLDWVVTAKGGSASDALAVQQRVESAVPVRVLQATLAQLAKPRELPVKAPATAEPDRGGVRVSLQSSLADGLGTVRDAMSHYRYDCLEQDVSIAVVLDDDERWSAAMDKARDSLDPDGLLRFFPSDHLQGSPILTAYVLTIADASGKTVPEDLKDAMIEGLTDYLAGRVVRKPLLRVADSQFRRLSALAALARHDALRESMLAGMHVNLATLPTSALLDWLDVLTRVDPDSEQIGAAKATLRARLSLQGTTMGFSTEHRDRLWWLMVSTDANAARTILALLDDPDWQTDLPRMVRGLFGRQLCGRWQTTVANAWGTLAANAFRAAFEAEPITGTSVVGLGEVQHHAHWQNAGAATVVAPPPPIELPWSAAETLSLAHNGTGAPWSLIELRAALPLTDPVERGYRIRRQVEPVERKNVRGWSPGDIARIVLDIDATAEITWVVVEDPLPPGAVVLGSGLGDDSAILGQTHVPGDRWPIFVERDLDSYRAYYHYLPKGRTTLRYNVRYNTAGRFQLPPSRVEAMYAPEMHAEQPVRPITIR